MDKTYSISIRGKSGSLYSFNFKGDSKYVSGWIEEGFDVAEVVNTIPVFIQRIGLTRIWIAIQDLWKLIKLF